MKKAINAASAAEDAKAVEVKPEEAGKSKIASRSVTIDGKFGSYDLVAMGLPEPAWPNQKENKGQHGYTLKSESGAVFGIQLKRFWNYFPFS